LKPTRLISPPGTYFLTFSTWQRRELFVVEEYVRIFLKTLYHYRREGRYALHAFVIMPEHVHLLLTPARDVTIEKAVQLIKGVYSHALGTLRGRKAEVWQRGFTDHRIRDADDFASHLKYIHQNPVVARIVIEEMLLPRHESCSTGLRKRKRRDEMESNHGDRVAGRP